jgi:hypothetical protein
MAAEFSAVSDALTFSVISDRRETAHPSAAEKQ